MNATAVRKKGGCHIGAITSGSVKRRWFLPLVWFPLRPCVMSNYHPLWFSINVPFGSVLNLELMQKKLRALNHMSLLCYKVTCGYSLKDLCIKIHVYH